METSLNVTHLRPKPTKVTLYDSSEHIVPVFDAKAIILDMLTNKTCMQEQNKALGYDVFSGDVDEKHIDNQRYGEIHTGDSWLPARDRFCPRRENESNMPVGLIIFGDKSHTNLHGTLALTPIIFTLTNSMYNDWPTFLLGGEKNGPFVQQTNKIPRRSPFIWD
jgi:hypothetical protein